MIQLHRVHRNCTHLSRKYLKNQARIETILHNYNDCKTRGEVMIYLTSVSFHLKLSSYPNKNNEIL